MMLGTAPSLSGFDATMEAIRVLRVVLSVRCRRAWLRGTARERNSGSHDRSLVSWMHGHHRRVVRHFRTRTLPARSFPVDHMCNRDGTYSAISRQEETHWGIDAHWLCCFSCCPHRPPTCKLVVIFRVFARVA